MKPQVEPRGYARRRAYRYERCQTWKSSGGRMGGTSITNGCTGEDARPIPTPFRVSVCAARTLNIAGQSRVTLSLQ